MLALEFNEITADMDVLYVLRDELHALKVISTTHGHPSVPLIRLTGGFTLKYAEGYRHKLFKDNPVNRTEVLLEDVQIVTGGFT